MSRHDTGTKSFSFERVLWEIQRAFYSSKNYTPANNREDYELCLLGI